MTSKKVLGLVLIVVVWLSFVRFIPKMVEDTDELARAKQPRTWQVEAVRMGHGEWVPDLEGNTTFQWLATQTAEAVK